MTNGKPPDKELSDEELGRLADEYVRGKKWRDALALSDEEREAKIQKSGIDRDKVREAARLAVRRMKEAEAKGGGGSGGGGPPGDAAVTAPAPAPPDAPPAPADGGAKVIPLAPRRARWAIPLGVAASLAGLAYVEAPALVAWLDTPSLSQVGSRPPEGMVKAGALLDEANADIEAKRYAEGLRKLDEAVRVYPEAAEWKTVKAARKRAEEGLGE